MAKYNWPAPTYQTNVLGNAAAANAVVASNIGIANVNTYVPFFQTINGGLAYGQFSSLKATSAFTFNGNALVLSTSGTGNAVSINTDGSITASGNIVAATFVGNGAGLTGVIASGASLEGNLAGNLLANGFFLNNLTALSVGGDVATGNLIVNVDASVLGNVIAVGNITGNYITGNGAFLTGLPAGYSNANVDSYLPVYTGNLNAGNVVISGNLQVQGVTTTVNANTLSVANLQITVGADQSTPSVLNTAGILVGDNNTATWLYEYTTNSWQTNINATPAANAGLNLGGTLNYWNNVYAVGGVYAGNVSAADFQYPNGVSVVTSLGDSIANTNSNVANLSSNVATLSNTVSDTGNAVTVLQGNVTSLSGAITSTNSNVANNSANITILQGNIGSLSGNVYSNVNARSYLATYAGPLVANNISALGIVSAAGNIITDGYFIGNFVGNVSGNLTVPGLNTEVLYNDNGNAGASSNFMFDYVANILSVVGTVNATDIVTTNSVGILGDLSVTGNISAPGSFRSVLFNDNGIINTATGFYVDAANGAVDISSNLSVTGTVISANVDAGNVNAANVYTTAKVSAAGGVESGTIVLAQGNIRGGNLISNDAISAVGNILTAANISAGGFVYGNGYYLTGIPASYGNVDVANYLANGADPTISNINSNIANLVLSTTGTTSNVANLTSNVANLSSNVANNTANITILQGNVVSLTGAVYSNANVANYLPVYTGNLNAGNVVIQGNLQVQGTTTTVNVASINVDSLVITTGYNQADPSLIDGGGLAVGNGEIITWFYEYTTNTWQSNVGITPKANASLDLGGTLNYWNNVYAGNGIFSSNVLAADFQYPNGVSVVNTLTNAIANTNSNVANNTSDINVLTGNVASLTGASANTNSNVANVVGNVTILQGNVANITAAVTSLSGNVYANANVANYLPIYSGNIASGNVNTTGNIAANYFIGNGSLLTGMTASRIANGTSNVNVYSSGNVSVGVDGISNVVLVTINSVSVAGNINAGSVNLSGFIATQNGLEASSAYPGPYTDGIVVDYSIGNGRLSTGSADGFEFYNSGVGNFLLATIDPTGTFSATANIAGQYVYGNGAYLTGLPASYGNANVADYLPLYTGNVGAGNISVTGNVGILGNIQAGYLLGNGSQLTGLPAQYANSNVAAYLQIYTGNITANTVSATGALKSSGTITATGNIYTSGYFVGNFAGNITGNLQVPGSTTQVLYNDNGNAGASPFFTFDSANTILTVSGEQTVTGNVTADNFLGTGVNVSANVAGANIVGSDFTYPNGVSIINTYSNATVANYLANGSDPTIANISNNVSNNSSNIAILQGNVTSLSANVANLSAGLNTVAGIAITAAGNTVTLQANVASLAGVVYTNANVDAYLPTYAGNLAAGNAIITGNLQVLGNTVTVNATTLNVANLTIGVGSDQNTASALNGAGLLVGNTAVGNTAVASWLYNFTANSWQSNIGITPTAGNVIDLGSATLPWGNVYSNVIVASAYQYPNGQPFTSYSNANVASYLPVYSGNITASNISTTGNITTSANILMSAVGGTARFVKDDSDGGPIVAIEGTNINGNTQTWTFLTRFNPVGQYSSWINFPDSTLQYTAYPGSSIALSLSGSVASGYIKSVGDITAVGNVYGNILIGNTASISGNIRVGNISAAGSISATGNIIVGTALQVAALALTQVSSSAAVTTAGTKTFYTATNASINGTKLVVRAQVGSPMTSVQMMEIMATKDAANNVSWVTYSRVNSNVSVPNIAITMAINSSNVLIANAVIASNTYITYDATEFTTT